MKNVYELEEQIMQLARSFLGKASTKLSFSLRSQHFFDGHRS